MNIRKIPLLKRLAYKFDCFDEKISQQEREINDLSAQLQNYKHKFKSYTGQKINVVFICHRPQVWNSLKTVCEQCIADDSFEVTIVAIPIKKQLPDIGFAHEEYASEGAEEYFKNYPCRVINGYNYETKKWFDLRSLDPDFVFFQQPYNVAKCEQYKSWNVSKYATICHVGYGYNCVKELGYDCLPSDFVKNVALFFAQHYQEDLWMDEWFASIGNTFTKKIVTGFPRFDNLEEYRGVESAVWKTKSKDNFRIIWTPRWTTNENNCHFFDYKDKWVDYCDKNQNVDFVFRPHPQSWRNYAANDNYPIEESEKYKLLYAQSNNMNIDTEKDFLPMFYSSNVLVTDYSSVIAEYFLTGNPIIYCYKEGSIYNPEGKWTDAFYYVRNWTELVNVLAELKCGRDPLKQKRLDYIKSEFYIPEQGSGYRIKEELKKYFRGDF